MDKSRLSRLSRRVLSADFAWLAHRLGISRDDRLVAKRPEPLVSRVPVHPFLASREAPCRILFISHNLAHEGASISLMELVLGLAERGAIAPQVIAFEEGPLRSQYESAGVPVSVLPSVLNRVSTLGRLDSAVRRLSGLLRAKGVDLVFVNTLSNFPILLAAEQAGLPSILNVRESEPWEAYFNFLPGPVAERAVAAVGLPRAVVFVANSTRAVWKDFERDDQFITIHNALNPVRFQHYLELDRGGVRSELGWGADEFVLLCVGTVCERKGQGDALKALQAISGRLNQPVRLVLAGDASTRYARELKVEARSLKRNPLINVDFVQPGEAIGRFYRGADAFLLCSRFESYPRVTLEAMAFGLPVISTPVFGIVQQIPDANDARLYPPMDSIRLSALILEMATDAALREYLAGRSRIRFLTLTSFAQMSESYRNVIFAVLDTGTVGSGFTEAA